MSRFLAGAVGAVAFAAAGAAFGQTAAQINQLNNAMQICNSPMGAGIAECASLRAKLNQGGLGAIAGSAAPGLGGLTGAGAGGFAGLIGQALGGGGGGAAGVAGMLGQAFSAAGAAAGAAPAAAPMGNMQQVVAACVQNAGGNIQMIQACGALAGAAPMAPSATAGLLPTDARAHDAATATYGAAQAYHACVAANPAGWQSCVPLMSGGAQPALTGAYAQPGLGGAAAAAAPAAAQALIGLFRK